MIYCDNLSTVLLSANPILHSRTKHLELDLYFVREKVQNKDILVSHISSKDQIADILTKPLHKSQFQLLRSKLRVAQCTSLSLQGGDRILDESRSDDRILDESRSVQKKIT